MDDDVLARARGRRFTVRSRTVSPPSANVTVRLPGSTSNGPTTLAVATPLSTDSPSIETSSVLPGRP